MMNLKRKGGLIAHAYVSLLTKSGTACQAQSGLSSTSHPEEPVSHVPEKSHPVRLLAQPLQKSTGKRNVSSFEFPPSDIAVSDW